MFYLIVFLLLFFNCILGEEKIVVDLREPCYEAGVLTTTKGGVIKGPKFRLQAENITYTKKKEGPHKVEASCFVMVDFGDYVFVGDRFEYDFETEVGVIYNGRTAEKPWYIGGEVIDLLADGSYLVHGAFITTSENREAEWKVQADTVLLSREKCVEARNLTFRVMKAPLLWLPKLKLNLNTLTDAPLHFYFRWGGQQGIKAGLKYELFSWHNFKTFLRVDYRLKRGPGAGIETCWHSEDSTSTLETINYVASDSSVENPHEKVRYRVQGVFTKEFESTDLLLSWDKLSDKDMATDYADNGLELDGAERTELVVRHQQNESFITNFVTRVRINSFQTIKQELPTLEVNFKPYSLGRSGVIWDNLFRISYLDFAYASDIIHAPDFNSTRSEYTTKMIRPYQLGYLTLTPELGATAIYYGNSPQNDAKLLSLALIGVSAHTAFSKTWDSYKQVIEPYAKWTYLTAPTVPPPDHYIFDIDDGWARLNTVRIGARQSLFRKSPCGIYRLLAADLYTFAFINTHTQPTTFPKAFLELTYYSLPTLRHTLLTGWNFRFGDLDQFNLRTDWTVSNNLAVSCEYRHRSRFAFRKAVAYNYILESFRTVNELLHSQLSDRRDTLLVHLYYQFHPQWALELESRQGWHRRHEPSYNEYEIDLITRLQSHWNLKISYQHKQGDHRVALYMWLQYLQPCEDSCPLSPIAF